MSNDTNKVKTECETDLLNKKRVASPFDMLREGSRRQAQAESQGKKGVKKRTDKEDFEEIKKLVIERKINNKVAAEVSSVPSTSMSNNFILKSDKSNSNYVLDDYSDVFEINEKFILSDDLKPSNNRIYEKSGHNKGVSYPSKHQADSKLYNKLSEHRKLNVSIN